MHDRYDIILFGSYFADLIFTGLPDMPRLSADLFASEFDMVPGGVYRAVLALQRLGLRAGWPVDFGNDLFSRFVLEQARTDQLDDSLFRMHPFPLRRLSVAFSFTHDRGFISYHDQAGSIDPVEVITQHQPRAIVISSLNYGPAHAAQVAAARACGALVYMDCQAHPETLATPGVVEALQRVDIFAPNEHEALALTGESSVEQALQRLAALTPTVIIKRGAAGSIASSGGVYATAPALPVEVLDTTGAGDCFNAGFLYGYLGDRPLETCLRAGNICGGLATTTRCASALPTAARLEELLRDEF